MKHLKYFVVLIAFLGLNIYCSKSNIDDVPKAKIATLAVAGGGGVGGCDNACDSNGTYVPQISELHNCTGPIALIQGQQVRFVKRGNMVTVYVAYQVNGIQAAGTGYGPGTDQVQFVMTVPIPSSLPFNPQNIIGSGVLQQAFNTTGFFSVGVIGGTSVTNANKAIVWFKAYNTAPVRVYFTFSYSI